MDTPKEFVKKLLEDETATAPTFNRDDLDEFTRAYLEAALWSSNDESDERGGNPMDQNYSVEDFSPECLKMAIEDCKKFREINTRDLELAELEDSRSGHCFWLSRCGHGSGFFDEYSVVDSPAYDAEPGDALLHQVMSKRDAFKKTENDPYHACQRLQDASKKFGNIDLYVGDDGQIYCM